jgi:hypothetical protein
MTAPDRAAMVAAIHALADFVETRTDLPVPTSVHAQHSLPGHDPTNADAVREAAAALDVEPDIAETYASVRVEISAYPTMVVYTVHGFTSHGFTSQPEGGAS